MQGCSHYDVVTKRVVICAYVGSSYVEVFRVRARYFWRLLASLGDVGRADDRASCLRKCIAMRSDERGGLKREFLAIKGIPRCGIEHTVSLSPRNGRCGERTRRPTEASAATAMPGRVSPRVPPTMPCPRAYDLFPTSRPPWDCRGVLYLRGIYAREEEKAHALSPHAHCSVRACHHVYRLFGSLC